MSVEFTTMYRCMQCARLSSRCAHRWKKMSWIQSSTPALRPPANWTSPPCAVRRRTTNHRCVCLPTVSAVWQAWRMWSMWCRLWCGGCLLPGWLLIFNFLCVLIGAMIADGASSSSESFFHWTAVLLFILAPINHTFFNSINNFMEFIGLPQSWGESICWRYCSI